MGIKYEIAKDVQNLAETLIAKYHPHLVDANIAYIFKTDTWKKNGKTILGSAHRCSEKEKLLHGYDFIITLNHFVWATVDVKTKMAILDHELCHCGWNDDEAKFILVPHDLEDFVDVVRRHGLYMPDVEAMGRAMHQLNLFEKPNLKVVGGNE
jgi:hypothetical protein